MAQTYILGDKDDTTSVPGRQYPLSLGMQEDASPSGGSQRARHQVVQVGERERHPGL